jgi:metal-responsive CopG/Arc/MetJ family transcriptional regulator
MTGKKTATISVTVGTAEMEMLKEIVKACGFLTTSEAVRAVIRHYYETKLPTCKADGRREAV